MLAVLLGIRYSQIERDYKIEVKPDAGWESQYCIKGSGNCSLSDLYNAGQPLPSNSYVDEEGVPFLKKKASSLTSAEIKEKHKVSISLGGPSENYYLAEALFKENQTSLGLEHLLLSANTGLPEARYKLASFFEEESSPTGKDIVQAYEWYQATDDVFRTGGSDFRYNDAEDKAAELRLVLTKDQLSKANLRLNEIRAASDNLSREYAARFNTYFLENQQ